MPTFNVLDMYSALRREIHLIWGQELKKLDFGHKQTLILYHLGSLKSCTMTELASLTLSDKATITRAVDALERLGLVQRTSDATDSRKSVITLTPKGRRQAERAQSLRDVIGLKINETLTRQEQKQLSELLEKVARGLKNQRSESEP